MNEKIEFKIHMQSFFLDGKLTPWLMIFQSMILPTETNLSGVHVIDCYISKTEW